MLQLLVLVFPLDLREVDLKRNEIFGIGTAKGLFDFGEVDQKERVTNFANVQFFESEDMTQLMLFIRSHK